MWYHDGKLHYNTRDLSEFERNFGKFSNHNTRARLTVLGETSLFNIIKAEQWWTIDILTKYNVLPKDL